MSLRSLAQNWVHMLTALSRSEAMNQRNNTRVTSALIDSRTKMKQSVTRIPFTFGSSTGLVPPSTVVTTMHSILPPLLHPPTILLPHNRPHPLPIRLQPSTYVATAAINFQMNPNRTGMRVLHTSLINTNLVNVISRKSSSVQITFASTSSTVTPAPVANGQINWRKPA